MWSQITKKHLKLDQNPSIWFHCVVKRLSRHLTKEGRQLASVLLGKCLNYFSWEHNKMPDRIHLKELGLTFVHSFRGLNMPQWRVMVGQSSSCPGGPRIREMWAATAHLAPSFLPLLHETVVPTHRWNIPSVSSVTLRPGNVTGKTYHHLHHGGISN